MAYICPTFACICPTFPAFDMRLGYIWGTFPIKKKGRKPAFGVHLGYIWGALLHPPYPPVGKAPALGRGAFP